MPAAVGLSYEDASRLIHEYGKGAIWMKHCIAVSRLGARFGEIFSERYDIDLNFLKTAALLHDIGRYKTHDPIMHGVEGYRLLSDCGHHREAFVCASHVLFGLGRAEAVRYGLPPVDFIPVTFEECLIPVLDSLADGDRPATIETRLSSIRERYKGDDFFLHRLEALAMKTREYISRMDEEFGISMEKVAAEILS